MRYHEAQRALQDRFDTRRLADRLADVKSRAALSEEDAGYIAARDMFFLATVDPQGFPQCSYKGGDPGFVAVVDPHTLAFPNYDGNGMYLSLGNVEATAHVGMLFIDWGAPSRLRVNGDARILHDDPLLPRWPEAQFVVRVAVREVFPNCPRYIHTMQTVERSRFVPQAGTATPVPGWKASDWARDVLPGAEHP